MADLKLNDKFEQGVMTYRVVGFDSKGNPVSKCIGKTVDLKKEPVDEPEETMEELKEEPEKEPVDEPEETGYSDKNNRELQNLLREAGFKAEARLTKKSELIEACEKLLVD